VLGRLVLLVVVVSFGLGTLSGCSSPANATGCKSLNSLNEDGKLNIATQSLLDLTVSEKELLDTASDEDFQAGVRSYFSTLTQAQQLLIRGDLGAVEELGGLYSDLKSEKTQLVDICAGAGVNFSKELFG
jgi:hypothetical protein